MKTEEAAFLELTKLVDFKEYVEAKELMTHYIQEDQPKLVKKMMDYYREYVCELCLGDGFTVEGTLDNQYEAKCECQNDL